MYHYKTTLYAPTVDKSLPNYQEIRSKVCFVLLFYCLN